MNLDAFRNLDELNMRNVFQHLSRFGSYVYLWKSLGTQEFITSPDVYDLFGYNPHPERFTTGDWEALIDPEDLPAVIRAEKELIAGLEPKSIEYGIRTGDGTRKYIRQSLELIRDGGELRILIIMQDITEQKRAETILNIMNEGLFDLSNDFVFRRVNAEAEQFLGRSREELTGKKFWEAIPEAADSEFLADLRRIGKDRMAIRKEYLFPANGRWVLASMAPYPDGVITVFFDITDLKRVGDELVRLNESLDRKNKELEHKNTELNSFSYITSNDLKAPLRKLYTSFEMILTQEGFKLSNNAKAHFRKIQASLQKMNLLTDDLYAFSRVDKNGETAVPTDLNEVREEARGKLSRNGPSFELVSDPLPLIEGYPEMLLQLFLHLIGNGIKFRREDRVPQIAIRYALTRDGDERPDMTGDFHRLRFADNGIGFDEKHQEEIFNIFFRIHPGREYKGTGVGLAICRKIMERHGGFITGSSSPEGAAFDCYFPFLAAGAR